MKKHLLSVLLASFLALATTNCNKYVPEGKIGISQKSIIYSKGFCWCSAVILDYKNKAIYAHDLPHSYDKTDIVDRIKKTMRHHTLKSVVCTENKFPVSFKTFSFEDKGARF